MPWVKCTSINLDSRIRELPRRRSSKISSLSGEDKSHERTGEGETNADENCGVSVALIAGEDENSDESSLK